MANEIRLSIVLVIGLSIIWGDVVSGQRGGALEGLLAKLAPVLAKIQGILLEPIEFEDFVVIFDKTYCDYNEKEKRERVFNHHQEEVIYHNRRYVRNETIYYQGIHEYSDLTDEEVEQGMMGNESPPPTMEESLSSMDMTETSDVTRLDRDDDEGSYSSIPLVRRKRQLLGGLLSRWRGSGGGGGGGGSGGTSSGDSSSGWGGLVRGWAARQQAARSRQSQSGGQSGGQSSQGGQSSTAGVRRGRTQCLDWRAKGVVGPIKNQGSGCSSCWAFASTALVESFFAVAGQRQGIRNAGPQRLSEQELIDCTSQKRSNYKNQGCSGGHPIQSFPYVKAQGGMNTDSCYPYTGTEGNTCGARSSCTHDRRIRIRGAVFERYATDDQLESMIRAYGPISISYHASANFMRYKGGILDDSLCDPSSSPLNHGGLLVGLCEENGVPYYIVKNSWGSTWGEQGFFRIKRHDNHCGIGLDVVAILPQ